MTHVRCRYADDFCHPDLVAELSEKVAALEARIDATLADAAAMRKTVEDALPPLVQWISSRDVQR